METISAPELQDKWITVDGLSVRYLEAGSGTPVLLLHGGSLGSSADVFRRNIKRLAADGMRAISFDHPGFGKTDLPADHTTPYRRGFVLKFLDAMNLPKVALFAHSQAGGMAVQLALAEPERFSSVMILGTGSLLPPLPDSDVDQSEIPQRKDNSKPPSTPTRETTRKLMESQLFHHELITDPELDLRYSHTVGKPFEAHVARWQLTQGQPANKSEQKKAATPLWQRLTELKMPLLMIYGREDRAEACKRAELLKSTYPKIDMHIVTGCKHMVPWDAYDEVHKLAPGFFKS
ncbi:MAG: 4,5:9,10-diseco-3-hydroxy-5,9, 17-trioxoandrosta(10),2-diene-4-oate hydrolase [Pseudomonadota bacterium]|jgi:pimeloyl-ACP methyl ester carboxylesterase